MGILDDVEKVTLGRAPEVANETQLRVAARFVAEYVLVEYEYVKIGDREIAVIQRDAERVVEGLRRLTGWRLPQMTLSLHGSGLEVGWAP